MIKSGKRNKKVFKQISRLNELTREAIEHASYVNGKLTINSANKEILKKPKGGRTYIVRGPSGRRRRHVASAPGQTHANLTGKLRRSLSFKVGHNEIRVGYGLDKGDAPEYAAAVEFGSNRMRPRPSVFNAIKAERRNYQNNFEREIGKRLGKKVT